VVSLLSRLVLLVIAVLLPVIGIQAYTEVDLRRHREMEVRAEALRQAMMFSRELHRMIEGARQVLVAFSETEALRTADAEACNRFAHRLERRYPQFIDIAAADVRGHVFCGSFDPAIGVMIADQPYFRQAMAAHDFVMGELTTARAGGHQFLPVALPFFDAGGQVGGVVFAAFELSALQEILRDKLLRPDGSLTVTDRKGMILLRHPDSEGWIGHRMPERFMPRLTAEQEGTEIAVGLDGLERIDAYIPPRHPLAKGLMVSMGFSVAEAFDDIDAASRRGMLLNGAALLLALAAAWLVAHYFVRRPVALLVQAASRWRQGDYAARTRLTADRAGEFGRIGAAFDAMAVELEERERELRDANRFKSRLLAIAAHDLRQPLQVIISTYEWFLSRAMGAASEQDRRSLAQANRAADRLIHQVDLLAGALHVEAKGLKPQPENLRLTGLLSEIAEFFGPQAEAKGIDLRVMASRALVHTDPSMLQTILHNLVGNAVKYTEAGGTILVGCRRRGDHLVLQVLDTGIGIPEQKLTAIFAAFYRVDPARDNDGLGLGLSIVKRTAEILGCRLSVRSVPGRGSCFGVELPLAPPAVGQRAA
jgi:signal transduction histidine kinase